MLLRKAYRICGKRSTKTSPSKNTSLDPSQPGELTTTNTTTVSTVMVLTVAMRTALAPAVGYRQRVGDALRVHGVRSRGSSRSRSDPWTVWVIR